MTRAGIPYEENGFQVRSAGEVGAVELRDMNVAVIKELRELDAELRKQGGSVVDVFAGRRPLEVSDMRIEDLSVDKINNSFVETMGHSLLSREDNLELLRRIGVKADERSLRAFLDKSAKRLNMVGEGVEVRVVRWPLLADLVEAFGA